MKQWRWKWQLQTWFSQCPAQGRLLFQILKFLGSDPFWLFRHHLNTDMETPWELRKRKVYIWLPKNDRIFGPLPTRYCLTSLPFVCYRVIWTFPIKGSQSILRLRRGTGDQGKSQLRASECHGASEQGHEKQGQAKWHASYLFIVRGKYLQIITAFCLHDNDVKRAEEEFNNFNFKRDVKQLQVLQGPLCSGTSAERTTYAGAYW